MMYFKSLLFVLSLVLVAQFALAQDDLDGYNDYSLRPIHIQNQFYKQTHWSYMDLREKQNRPFFAENNQLTALIIEAVKAGIIRPFQSDSLVNRMKYETFIQNLTMEGASEEADCFLCGWDEDESWETETDTKDDLEEEFPTEEMAEIDESSKTEISNEYFPNQLYVLEIKEDIIFDKKNSRMKKQIQAITIKIPAEQSPMRIEKPLATFSYKKLVNNVFRDNPKAIWYNQSNLSTSLNYTDAFENRLFSAHLIKYVNGENVYVEDIYGAGKKALLASRQIEYEMLDRKMDMWEN